MSKKDKHNLNIDPKEWIQTLEYGEWKERQGQ